MTSVDKVSVSELIKKEKLVNLTPDVSTDDKFINIPNVNRPALQLTGFFDQFDSERVQIIGNVENAYLMSFEAPQRRAKYDAITKYNMPCIIYARNIEPDSCMIDACRAAQIPLLQSPRPTTELEAEIIGWLKVKMAPMISVHGVLVDVYGEGVLIMGDSGIGKSEAALELIKRGHRLVSDDVVEIRKVSDETLVGSAPDITKHFIELRGIGIIDVMQMFGVECVMDTQNINMVIKLAEWSKDKDYDRLGLKDNYTEFLGNKVICYDIPVRPGRNIAIIVECAAVNNRAKKMGYNAAQVLYDRVTANMKSGED
ncbi:HPr(Ser) kinase/phosphatase [Oribacterium sp. C9]|uniref:HPr(Ser) kinase/phosphatase n=1 Tax=Oribacterium sp. C9 TaxID=1943579 RepID=UPI00098F3498|nr:HPr(Ser) kinase/phosphatase [Oribacterium sp. C9]OON87392.1 HPr(Ser) kinase/phosphatase [Oribacterium sp. C9]